MYEITIGAEKITLTDAQLDMWANNYQLAPPYVQAAIDFRSQHGAGNSGVIVQPNGSMRLDTPQAQPQAAIVRSPSPSIVTVPRQSVITAPSYGVSDGNNAVWYHTFAGTSTLSLQEVKPNDPITISDLAWDTDDATARLSLIKQGSTELFAGSGAGVLITSLRDDQKFRAMFAGRLVTRERPLLCTVVHAGSGSPTSTVRIIGYKAENDASACGK